MKPIDEFLELYAELETAIREQMIDICGSTCAICTVCCCRTDICEEVQQSAFLSRLLEEQGRDVADMDDRFGWIDVNGCSLEVGRPPICYAYFCDELLARLPDDDTRLAARTLGRLLFHTGRNAIGDRHLTEITSATELDNLDLDRMTEQLDEAKQIFTVIEEFMQAGRLSSSSRELLGGIPQDDL